MPPQPRSGLLTREDIEVWRRFLKEMDAMMSGQIDALCDMALTALSETQRHVHTCMSCGEAWFCPHQPGDCTAPPKVMPSLILRGPSGPTVFHHDCKGKK